MTDPRSIFILANEASGDALGASLVQQLADKPAARSLRFYGIGGQKMAAAGVELIQPMQSGIIGIAGILKHLPQLISHIRKAKSWLKQHKPALLILIDSPALNLRMAKFAKRQGITVLYYVSPQIWAWHYSRIHTIRRCIDHMAVLFPFEKAIYDHEGIPASFVGHPLIKQAHATLPTAACYTQFGLSPDKPIVVLLPGSRRQELQDLLGVMVASCQRLQKKYRDIQFVLVLAPTCQLPEDCNIKVLPHDELYNVLSIADAAMVTSGTVTLEVALFGVPLVIVYKTALLKFGLKFIVKTNYIGLCNITAQTEVAKELLQDDANPQMISREIERLLFDRDYRQQRLSQLTTLNEQLRAPKETVDLAELVLELY